MALCMYLQRSCSVSMCGSTYISLSVNGIHANFVRFRGSVSLLPHLCSLSVPEVGVFGDIQKALENSHSEHPRFACCTDDMVQVFVRFGRCLCCLLPPFVNRQTPCVHINSHPVLLLPLLHHKSFWCAKELALGGGTLGASDLKCGWQPKSLVLPSASNLHARTKSITFCPLMRPLPLNTGWVPVKGHRLQDRGKLKKYVPVHKQCDVCPNGVPALPEKGNANDEC